MENKTNWLCWLLRHNLARCLGANFVDRVTGYWVYDYECRCGHRFMANGLPGFKCWTKVRQQDEWPELVR